MLELLRGDRKDAMENPYLNARRAWNSHVGYVVASRRVWQVVALMSLLIALAAVGGMITMAVSSKYIPYVVEVDRLGQVMAVNVADGAAEADPRIVQATIARWIQDARMVTFDRAALNAAIWRVYAHLRTGDPATAKITAYMQDPQTDPIKRAETASVGVQIESLLQETRETWQAIWSEVSWSRTGEQTGVRKYRALVTVYSEPGTSTTTEDEIRANPLGIYVRDYNWSQIVDAAAQPLRPIHTEGE